MMISALKITAERMADSGVRRCITFRTLNTGNAPANIAGMIAKYLATSLATENVDSRFAGDRSRGKRVVARDHHRANPHSAQMIEAFLHAPLHNVCKGYRAQYSAALCNQQRCSTRIRNFSDTHLQLGGNAIAAIPGQAADSL